MEDFQLIIALIFVSALILFFLYSICRTAGLWTWSMNWMFSPREEKVNLTRTNGHYNANGYLVPAESMNDINLCHSGSFKRFETVDHEYAFEMSDFTSEPMLQQPPEQRHDYPQDVVLPCGSCDDDDDSVSDDSSDDEPYDRPSCSGANRKRSRSREFTTIFIHSNPLRRSSSTALLKHPTQPLQSVPSYPDIPAVHAKYESEKPGKGKRHWRRSSTPVFSEVVWPQVAPRIQAPPLPPRRFPLPFERDYEIPEFRGLRPGLSFESISSDTSVALSDLDGPHVTGYLCVGVDYTGEYNDLAVSILEAKDLTGLGHDGHTLMDTYVQVNLGPDKTTLIQTKIHKKSNSPSYKDKFRFACSASEFHRRSLSFAVFSVEINDSTLIGRGELKLCDISVKQSVTTWITLTDTGQFRSEWGEIMLSLNYLPSAEKLTLVVIKAKNLVFQDNRETGNPFVKVYVLRDGKKIMKKKTTTKYNERDPIYNEAMIFNIPVKALQNLQLRVTVAEQVKDPRSYALGHVIMGRQAIGKTFSHWIQMLMSPRRPISMWHSLARVQNQ